MKLRSFGMLAIAALAAAPSLANSTFDLGTIYSTTVSAGNSWGANDVLSDTYTFDVAAGTDTFNFSLKDLGAIKNLSGTIYDSNGGIAGTLGFYTRAGAGGISNLGSLDVGHYSLVVTGAQVQNPLGKLNPTGSYSLSLQSNVAAPVPGPAGFVVAGAGALIVAARRRRAQRKNVVATA